MRLYSRHGVNSVTRQGETYEPDETGAFDFPEHVGRELRSYHAGGKPMWEDEIELRARLAAEELERRRDPATLMGAVEQIVGMARSGAAPASGQEAADISALRAELEELRAQLAAKDALPGGAAGGEASGDGKKASPRGGGKTPAKS